MDWSKFIGEGIVFAVIVIFVIGGIVWLISQGVSAGMQDAVNELKKTNDKLAQIEKTLNQK